MKLIHKLSFLLVTLVSSVSFADWTIQEENWYSVTIDGAKSGWAHELVEVDSETGNLQLSKVQNMTLSRDGMEISISVTTTFLETADGKPISVESIQEAMGMVQETKWIFGDEQLEMTTAAGGNPIVKKVPLPKEAWLTPQAVKRIFKKKMAEGAGAITYQTMAPELGPSVITVVMTKKNDEQQKVLGIEQQVIGWETVNDKMPVVGMEYYTADGLNVGSKMNAGFVAIENKLMSKHDALSPVNEVPEMMVSFFVEPNKPIAKNASKLTMRVKTKKDGTKVNLPSIGMQTVTLNDDGTATVLVDLNDPGSATEKELADESYLGASAICDGTDEAVIAIANDALSSLPEGASVSDRALALRSKVSEHISEKNMSTVFASASQTARSKVGDCSEHAVLLCGVLRAADIPSRGVMGMVYVSNIGGPNGVFGWHMWSQALIDGQWVDLDATLDSPYSVGHIATITSSLSDENFGAEMGGMLEIIGNLEVEIIDEE
ncbi:MAG: transglutaminase domain-containing protein [Planctomycetes bacterium]|nr:transglutaminase domain-containing protein [Planctomycetota bacterium]MBL6997032.1 transglutaminase domain-containing protein [Phycisphaerales bacterium]